MTEMHLTKKHYIHLLTIIFTHSRMNADTHTHTHNFCRKGYEWQQTTPFLRVAETTCRAKGFFMAQRLCASLSRLPAQSISSAWPGIYNTAYKKNISWRVQWTCCVHLLSPVSVPEQFNSFIARVGNVCWETMPEQCEVCFALVVAMAIFFVYVSSRPDLRKRFKYRIYKQHIIKITSVSSVSNKLIQNASFCALMSNNINSNIFIYFSSS